MKIKLIIFIRIILILSVSISGFSQTYETSGSVYTVSNKYISMKYNPFQPNCAGKGGSFLTNNILFVTSNKTESEEYTYRLHQTGLKLNLYYPKVISGHYAIEQKLPVIVFGYGGGFLNTYKVAGTTPGAAIPVWLASKGYVVIVPEYRIGIDLFDAELAKRAVWRATQDIRKVIGYCKSLQESEYYVDSTMPITYVGYSSGAFIGLSNLYASEANRPASTRANYQSFTPKNEFNTQVHYTSDLGTLDDVANDNSADIGMSNQRVQDITVSIAGAFGDLQLILDSPKAYQPKALYLIHHPDDGVVPYDTGKVYDKFKLFASPAFNFATVSGSAALHNIYTNDITGNIKPNVNYEFSVVYKNTTFQPPQGASLILGDSGSETGPGGYKTWYHNPTEGNANVDVMNSILTFIKESTYNILNPSTAVKITKKSTSIEKNKSFDDLNAPVILYPNPVAGNILNITNIKNNTPYKITNALGQILYNGVLKDGAVDIYTLATGTYFIELTVNEQPIVKQFIKQ